MGERLGQPVGAVQRADLRLECLVGGSFVVRDEVRGAGQHPLGRGYLSGGQPVGQMVPPAAGPADRAAAGRHRVQAAE